MPRTAATSAHQESIPRLLYDVEAVAKILSLTPAAIDQLCHMGELRPSVTIGNRRLFSVHLTLPVAQDGDASETGSAEFLNSARAMEGLNTLRLLSR